MEEDLWSRLGIEEKSTKGGTGSNVISRSGNKKLPPNFKDLNDPFKAKGYPKNYGEALVGLKDKTLLRKVDTAFCVFYCGECEPCQKTKESLGKLDKDYKDVQE